LLFRLLVLSLYPMAQRKDKTRKQNLENFKESQKPKTMSQEAPQMKPFRQVPTWQAQEKFVIEGAELEALYNYFNIVAPAFTAIQQVFARGIKANKVKLSYEYEDGTSVPEEEIAEYTTKLNQYFEEKLKSEQAAEVEPDTAEAEPEQPTAKLLNIHGAPVTE
jgi:hypothetical protein